MRQTQLDKVKSSPFWSILLDETTDVSVKKQLILHANYLDPDGKSHVTFLGMIEVMGHYKHNSL